MRKIQFDTCETENCDNDMQPASNAVRPLNVDSVSGPDEFNQMDIGVATTSVANDNIINDSLKEDLLNDSDFDQMLLTCTESVERNLSQEHMETETGQNVEADAMQSGSVPKPSQSNYMSLFNDESIDDILSTIDDSFIMNSINVKNPKLSRHNSMPQELQPQKLQSGPHKLNTHQRQQQPPQPQSSKVTTNRKSFARHESMPVAATNIGGRQANAQSSKWYSENSLLTTKVTSN